MGIFAPFSYFEKNAPAGPTGPAYEIRSDAYASYVYLAIPGTDFGAEAVGFTQSDGAWSDISGDINGGVSTKTITPYTNGYGNYYVSSSTYFPSEGYDESLVTYDGAAVNIAGSDLPFGSSNFVVEAWCLPAEVFNRPPYHKPLLRTKDGTGQLYLDNTANTTVSATTHRKRICVTGTFGDSANGAATYAVGTWKHVAYVRSGNTFYAYDNGVLKYSITKSATIPTPASGFDIMGFTFYTNPTQSNNENANWAMQDYRISIGTDRGYVGGFTPPASIIEKVS